MTIEIKKLNLILKMEKTFDFSLSIKNLKDIPFEMYEQDFTFHLKGKNYTTTRFIADLLSPYVRQLHYSDKSRQEFYIDHEHLNYQEDDDDQYFTEFLKLYTFENKKLSPKQREHYIRYFYCLGNFEEIIRLESEIKADIKGNEAVERLLNLSDIIKKNEHQTKFRRTDSNCLKRI